jgi:hypothetical protein
MSRVKLDSLYTHSKNVGTEKLGEFCGSPIVSLNEKEIDIDRAIDLDRTRLSNSLFPSAETDFVILLPGEVVCEDGVIRRSTSAEAVGYDEFHAFKVPADTKKVSIADARLASLAGELVTWRPNRVTGQEEFALIHTQEAAA